jgi:rare lipoprotein A
LDLLNKLSLAVFVICSYLGTSFQIAAASEQTSGTAVFVKTGQDKNRKTSIKNQYSKASWYGSEFHGKKTASGRTFNMYAMSAAHKTLPLLSYAKITNLKNHRSVIVRIIDRGPFHGHRDLDLSYAAAKKLGIKGVESVAILPLNRQEALSKLGKSNKAG